MRKVAPLFSVLGLMLMGAAFAAPPHTVTFDPDKAISAELTAATTNAGFPTKHLTTP